MIAHPFPLFPHSLCFLLPIFLPSLFSPLSSLPLPLLSPSGKLLLVLLPPWEGKTHLILNSKKKTHPWDFGCSGPTLTNRPQIPNVVWLPGFCIWVRGNFSKKAAWDPYTVLFLQTPGPLIYPPPSKFFFTNIPQTPQPNPKNVCVSIWPSPPSSCHILPPRSLLLNFSPRSSPPSSPPNRETHPRHLFSRLFFLLRPPQVFHTSSIH